MDNHHKDASLIVHALQQTVSGREKLRDCLRGSSKDRFEKVEIVEAGGVLARWAAALLAVGGVISVVLSVMPDAFYRLLALPNGIAMIALGYSLWREKPPERVPSVSTSQINPAEV